MSSVVRLARAALGLVAFAALPGASLAATARSPTTAVAGRTGATAARRMAPRPPVGEVRQVDPYPLIRPLGGRCIPDVRSGGELALPSDGTTWPEVVDWVILGDGFVAADESQFWAEAEALYEELFGDTAACEHACGTEPPACSSAGIKPYPYFPQAFRVRAVFNASAVVASEDRGSYYRMKIEGTGDSQRVARDGWWNAGGADDEWFRAKLRESLDDLGRTGPPHNPRSYPSGVDVTSSGDSDPIIHHRLSDSHSHLVVTFIVKVDEPAGDDWATGAARMVTTDFQPNVVVGFGNAPEHEFQHAFAWVEDEYIEPRGSVAARHDPTPAERSIYKLSNLTYSNARCDAAWSHLAPGGRYNANRWSLVGNYYRGGEDDEGAWHSEYQCLMNGEHDNYACDLTPASVNLRDGRRLCFRCEEIVALRILEKTGQLACPVEGPGIDECGRESYRLWVDTLRDRYYDRFAIADRIRARSRCLAGDPAYSTECDRAAWDGLTNVYPSCLPGCPIRDHGGLVHLELDAAASFPPPDGSRLDPHFSLVAAAEAACGANGYVAVVPGSYPGARVLAAPVVLTGVGRCAPAILGR